MKKGDKSLVGNKGYRRFLANPEGGGFSIDRPKVEEDAKFDGMFVLRTNASLSPLEAMLVYKQSWTVERTFRTTKSLLETRPIYHQLDETIRGHVACSFLALMLKKELEDRLAAANGARASWPTVIADLDSLTETEVEQDGKRFLLRSAPRPAASLALYALGLALPPAHRHRLRLRSQGDLRRLLPGRRPDHAAPRQPEHPRQVVSLPSLPSTGSSPPRPAL